MNIIYTMCIKKETVIMERNFPVILSELRKEKGLSQKEAAMHLDISQALLSHYEKGIRECGQSFLLKVADFYGVTTDYLLGRSKIRNGLEVDGNLLEPGSEDEKPGVVTYLKASAIMRNRLAGVDQHFDRILESVLAVQLYKILVLEAKAGNIPKNWAGRAFCDGDVYANDLFINMIDNASNAAVRPSKGKKTFEDEEVPEAIRTLLDSAEAMIFEAMTKDLPPIPIEYMK